jgi:hypothetical protein
MVSFDHSYKPQMHLASLVARHEAVTTTHFNVLSFHGIWAIACWLFFIALWILPKGTRNHIVLGRYMFWIFLFPLELTGLFLTPYLLTKMPRANITLTSGYLVVPSMNFHIVITTIRAFPFLRRGLPFANWFCKINFILQILGFSAVCYKAFFHVEAGFHHENNLEIFCLTFPFTIMQALLLFRRKNLGHPFYIKYLTLLFLPGTMVVVARDKYWLWGPEGLKSLWLRLLVEFLPMIPLFISVIPTIYKLNFKTKSILK